MIGMPEFRFARRRGDAEGAPLPVSVMPGLTRHLPFLAEKGGPRITSGVTKVWAFRASAPPREPEFPPPLRGRRFHP